MLVDVLRWPLRTPQNIVLLLFSLLGYVLLAMLRHSSEVLFELTLLILLPVFYLIFGMLALCGQMRLNDVARGRFVEPEYERGMLNPLQSAIAAKLTGLFAVAGSVWFLPEQTWLLISVAVIYPLFFLGLALEGSLRGLVNPQLHWRLLSGLNLRLPLLVLLVSGTSGWLGYVLIHDQRLLLMFSATALFLLMHPIVGLVIYTARDGLNLHTYDSPEQRRAADAIAKSDRLDRLLEDLQRLCGSGNLQQAVTRLEVYLVDEEHAQDAIVHERLRSFQDRRLFLEHGFRYLGRAHQRGERVLAWTLFKDCHAEDEQFRPASLRILLDLTEMADRGDARLVEALMGDAPRSYPDSNELPEACFRQARINIELLADGPRGLSILRQIGAQYPEYASGEAFQKYQRRLRINRRSADQSR